MVTIRELSTPLTRYGMEPHSLRRQDGLKGLYRLFPGPDSRTHFVSVHSSVTPQTCQDAFIVPLSTETKRDPQYMRVSQLSLSESSLRFIRDGIAQAWNSGMVQGAA